MASTRIANYEWQCIGWKSVEMEQHLLETEQRLLVLTPYYVMRHHGRKRPAQSNTFRLKYLFRRNTTDYLLYQQAPTNGDVELVNGDSPMGGDQLSQLSDDSPDPEDAVIPRKATNRGHFHRKP